LREEILDVWAIGDFAMGAAKLGKFQRRRDGGLRKEFPQDCHGAAVEGIEEA
jgi:hypothetical protein